MFDKLPKTVDPERLAQNGADFKGSYEQNAMPRLRDIVEEDSGVCEVDLALDYSKGVGLKLIGQVSAGLNLVCQRCLEGFKCEVTSEVNIELVREEGQEHREHDVFVLDSDGALPLIELVEDEILLQIPNMPKHGNIEDCKQEMIDRATEYVPEEDEEEKENPFAVLKNLKK
jgi:uncharacterized protein